VIWADQGSSSCGGFEQKCDGGFTPRCLQNEKIAPSGSAEISVNRWACDCDACPNENSCDLSQCSYTSTDAESGEGGQAYAKAFRYYRFQAAVMDGADPPLTDSNLIRTTSAIEDTFKQHQQDRIDDAGGFTKRRERKAELGETAAIGADPSSKQTKATQKAGAEAAPQPEPEEDEDSLLSLSEGAGAGGGRRRRANRRRSSSSSSISSSSESDFKACGRHTSGCAEFPYPECTAPEDMHCEDRKCGCGKVCADFSKPAGCELLTPDEMERLTKEATSNSGGSGDYPSIYKFMDAEIRGYCQGDGWLNEVGMGKRDGSRTLRSFSWPCEIMKEAHRAPTNAHLFQLKIKGPRGANGPQGECPARGNEQCCTKACTSGGLRSAAQILVCPDHQGNRCKVIGRWKTNPTGGRTWCNGKFGSLQGDTAVRKLAATIRFQKVKELLATDECGSASASSGDIATTVEGILDDCEDIQPKSHWVKNTCEMQKANNCPTWLRDTWGFCKKTCGWC